MVTTHNNGDYRPRSELIWAGLQQSYYLSESSAVASVLSDLSHADIRWHRVSAEADTLVTQLRHFNQGLSFAELFSLFPLKLLFIKLWR